VIWHNFFVDNILGVVKGAVRTLWTVWTVFSLHFLAGLDALRFGAGVGQMVLPI
jgi:hypothetical protein